MNFVLSSHSTENLKDIIREIQGFSNFSEEADLSFSIDVKINSEITSRNDFIRQVASRVSGIRNFQLDVDN